MATLGGIDTRWLYLALVALVAAERLVELAVTRRNVARLLARGGRPVGDEHYGAMVAVHTALLVAAPLEVWLLARPFVAPLALAMTALLALTMALRYWVIATLGERWTTRVVVVPGEPLVARGPYRFLRHPNYLGVALEGAALPLVHTAWWTAIGFAVANFFVLRTRIRVEDEALGRSRGAR
ncbi:MAG TPA: isoprenylcysteine carboxylmethyltransferase family protein [Thermoanaerobaculia bacterium]|jgi:methyltransferase